MQFNRFTRGLGAALGIALQRMASGKDVLAEFFANAFLSPDNWKAPPRGRKRPGAHGKPHARDTALKYNAKRSVGRVRFRREGPSWRDPLTLFARGVRSAERMVRAQFFGDGFVPEAEFLATPYPRRKEAIHMYRDTPGNRGPTVNKKLRRRFYAGLGGGKRAAALGVQL